MASLLRLLLLAATLAVAAATAESHKAGGSRSCSSLEAFLRASPKFDFVVERLRKLPRRDVTLLLPLTSVPSGSWLRAGLPRKASRTGSSHTFSSWPAAAAPVVMHLAHGNYVSGVCSHVHCYRPRNALPLPAFCSSPPFFPSTNCCRWSTILSATLSSSGITPRCGLSDAMGVCQPP